MIVVDCYCFIAVTPATIHIQKRKINPQHTLTMLPGQ